MTAVLAEQITEAAATADFGKPTARKAGRNPRYPYQPAITVKCWRYGTRTSIIPRRAFTTRDEAIAYAARHIDGLRAHLAKQLTEPGQRLLREQHGLPRELPR